jgi:hypothetical protein
VNSLFTDGTELAQNANYETDVALLLIYQEGIQRNKRCMLAYL